MWYKTYLLQFSRHFDVDRGAVGQRFFDFCWNVWKFFWARIRDYRGQIVVDRIWISSMYKIIGKRMCLSGYRFCDIFMVGRNTALWLVNGHLLYLHFFSVEHLLRTHVQSVFDLGFQKAIIVLTSTNIYYDCVVCIYSLHSMFEYQRTHSWYKLKATQEHESYMSTTSSSWHWNMSSEISTLKKENSGLIRAAPVPQTV